MFQVQKILMRNYIKYSVFTILWSDLAIAYGKLNSLPYLFWYDLSTTRELRLSFKLWITYFTACLRFLQWSLFQWNTFLYSIKQTTLKSDPMMPRGFTFCRSICHGHWIPFLSENSIWRQTFFIKNRFGLPPLLYLRPTVRRVRLNSQTASVATTFLSEP